MDEIQANQAKARRNILFLIIGIVIFVLVVNVGLGTFLSQRKETAKQSAEQAAVVAEVEKANTFSYKGEEGKDALALLQEKTTIEQEASGLVIAINGRKADDKKEEFWAFYVNGKMAEVGPADYQTKSGDTIEWKIETY
ncbi:MAG: DUF4430 domain-containing protein [bacterium]|nr:DUF4430 domain-containing protein [bacterium]